MSEVGDDALSVPSAARPPIADPFRLMVDAVQDYGIFMLDPSGHVSSWNPGAERSTGHAAADIIGHHVSCFYTAADVEAAKAELGLRIAFEQGRFEEEAVRVRKDGTSFWAIVTMTRIADTSGQHIGFANVVRDISERKRAESSLALHNRAIASLAQGICITDPRLPDNPIVYVNESFLRITGYEHAEVVGRNCRFLQGVRSEPDDTEIIRKAIREGRSCAVELVNYRKDGTPFWNGIAISPIRDADGEVAHFVGVLADISPQKLLQRQRQQLQKMEALGQLAGEVAQDFNAQLGLIFGGSQTLLDGMADTDPQRTTVAAINDAAERAAGLMHQLLVFSRHALPDSTILDVNATVHETEQLLQRLIGDVVSITATLDPEIRRSRMDRGQLGQVLVSLALNARAAMPRGGALAISTSEVELDAAVAVGHLGCAPGRYVVVAVSDTGCGMSPQEQAHVFQPLFPARSSREGSGSGLATVYRIVKEAGGAVEIDSELGFGTTVKLFLQAVSDPLDAYQPPDQRAPALSHGTETLIVVEDDDALLTVAVLTLQTRGYTVLRAANGAEALQLMAAHRGHVDCLITDVVMPGLSGPQLAEALLGAHPDLKVLYTSGYCDEAGPCDDVVAGDVAFLAKPYTGKMLATRVREILDLA